MANQSDHASRRQCRLGSFSGGVDRPYGKKTNLRETSERSAVLRESLRVIYAAVFSHSGGTEAKGGEIGGRRCYFSRVGSVFAPPESTCRAEQKPIMANQLARAPRWQCRLGFFAAGVDRPYGKLPNFRTQLRFGRVFSDLYWVAFFRSDRTKTKRGEQDGRRRFFERESGPFLLRWSRRHRVGNTNIGEDAARTGHFGSIGIASPPANLPVQEGNKRRSRTS